jgi:uncharacterized membrane protein YkvA (DUF1232 family)
VQQDTDVKRQIGLTMGLIATLKARARQIKTEVHALYLAARHPRTPWYAKLYLIAIVAYALSPIDLIPDFIPVLGFVDEIILLPFALVLAVRLVPESVMSECRTRASQQRPDDPWLGRWGAAFIGALWLALIVLAAVWAHRAFAHERNHEMKPHNALLTDATSSLRCACGAATANTAEVRAALMQALL